jgi:hypothetical protein
LWTFCLALSAAAGFAQFESATLTGIVTDGSGQVIPNVPVKAINEGTSVETRSTNAEGRQLPSLRPGSIEWSRQQRIQTVSRRRGVSGQPRRA